MNNTKIEKALDLLKNNKLEDLRLLLVGEMLGNSDKRTAKLFDIVNKYIIRAGKNRPSLHNILWRNGKQFILDGYTAFIFRSYISDFNNLPNLRDEDQCLNIYQVFNSQAQYNILPLEDLCIYINIKKYIRYYKQLPEYKKGDTISVFFAGRVFNAVYIELCLDILGTDFIHYNYINRDEDASKQPLQMHNGCIDALVLPIVPNQDEVVRVKTITNNFIKDLEEAL